MIKPDARAGCASLDQWFTPFWAAEELVDDAIGQLGAVAVCEPACGTGAFLAAVPQRCPAFGVDIDPRVIEAARANTGREILLGDFLTIELGDRPVELIMGNPPFGLDIVEGFIDRAHELLPDGGLLAMIMPTYAFQTPSRVTRWMDRFSIDVRMIPRTLFRGMEKPLLWVKYRKTADRLFHGLMLFRRQRDIELMAARFRAAVEGPGTWREAVRLALETLGGAASIAAIYDQIVPERRVSPHWRPKVRQTLQRHYRAVERGRWAL